MKQVVKILLGAIALAMFTGCHTVDDNLSTESLVLYREIFGTKVSDPTVIQEDVTVSGWQPRRGHDGSVPVLYLRASPGQPGNLPAVNAQNASCRETPERGFVNLFIAKGNPHGWLLATQETAIPQINQYPDLTFRWRQLTDRTGIPTHLIIAIDDNWFISTTSFTTEKSGSLGDFPSRAEQMTAQLTKTKWRKFNFPAPASPANPGNPQSLPDNGELTGFGLYLPTKQPTRLMIDTFEITASPRG